MQNTSSEILCVNFNQDQTLFAVGTDTGFTVFVTKTLEKKFERDLKGGIGIVELLYRSNIFALVGGGVQPKYPDNKVIIWDDTTLKCIGEMSFRDKIRNVKLKNDRVVVVLEKKVFVYNFSDLKELDTIDTYQNTRGICAINVEGDNTILATPDKQVGRVLVSHFGKNTRQISAHQSPISFLSLTLSGHRLATSSEKGTVIRLYDSETGFLLIFHIKNQREPLQEVRRGSDYATITSLAFNMKNTHLACASDLATIHIFGLKGNDEKDQEQNSNQTSRFAIFGSVIPFLKSEWSFAQLQKTEPSCKISFLDQNTFVAISSKGKYFKVQFDAEKGGECKSFDLQDIIQPKEEKKL